MSRPPRTADLDHAPVSRGRVNSRMRKYDIDAVAMVIPLARSERPQLRKSTRVLG